MCVSLVRFHARDLLDRVVCVCGNTARTVREIVFELVVLSQCTRRARQATTMLEATADANNRNAAAKAADTFAEIMDVVCGHKNKDGFARTRRVFLKSHKTHVEPPVCVGAYRTEPLLLLLERRRRRRRRRAAFSSL